MEYRSGRISQEYNRWAFPSDIALIVIYGKVSLRAIDGDLASAAAWMSAGLDSRDPDDGLASRLGIMTRSPRSTDFVARPFSWDPDRTGDFLSTEILGLGARPLDAELLRPRRGAHRLPPGDHMISAIIVSDSASNDPSTTAVVLGFLRMTKASTIATRRLTRATMNAKW